MGSATTRTGVSVTERRTRVECPTPRDMRWMREQASVSSRVAGCRVDHEHFVVTDETQFLHLKLAAGAKEIGDEY